MTQASSRPHADQAFTGLAVTFAIPAQAFVSVRFDYFMRQFEMVNNSSFGNIVDWGFSRTGVLATGEGKVSWSPADDPVRFFFYRDDEGPPWLYLFNTHVAQPASVGLWYLPTQSRKNLHVAPAVAGKLGYPVANAAGATIIPGL